MRSHITVWEGLGITLLPPSLPLLSLSALLPSFLIRYTYISSIYIVVSFHIQTLKQMKDRERLRNYINQIPLGRQREFRGKICALVDNTVSYNYSSVLLSAGLTVFFPSSANKMEDSLKIYVRVYMCIYVFVCGIFCMCVSIYLSQCFISFVCMLQLIAW